MEALYPVEQKVEKSYLILHVVPLQVPVYFSSTTENLEHLWKQNLRLDEKHKNNSCQKALDALRWKRKSKRGKKRKARFASGSTDSHLN